VNLFIYVYNHFVASFQEPGSQLCLKALKKNCVDCDNNNYNKPDTMYMLVYDAVLYAKNFQLY